MFEKKPMLSGTLAISASVTKPQRITLLIMPN
jgi:hypothetical protein